MSFDWMLAMAEGLAGGAERDRARSEELHREQPGLEVQPVVLTPVVVPNPIRPPVVTRFPRTIIEPVVEQPTVVLTGDEEHGGTGLPWTAGPVSIVTVPPIIGTMLIYAGSRVLVSLAVRAGNDLYGLLKKKYHTRGVSMRIHTGVGTMRGGVTTFESNGATSSPRQYPSGEHLVPVPSNPVDRYDFEFRRRWEGQLNPYDFVNLYGPEYGSWIA